MSATFVTVTHATIRRHSPLDNQWQGRPTFGTLRFMPYVRVQPDDDAAVSCAVEILNIARRQDDPDAAPALPELLAGDLRYGWDLEPDEMYLFAPTVDAPPIGILELHLPRRDNRHLVWSAVTVHPEHRRRGHGSALVAETIRRAREAGRSTVWMGAAEDDLGARRFLERFGFQYASHDARRVQRLAEVDVAVLDRLYVEAERAAADYELVRATLPTPDDVLEQLVDVTAAINDAPMGDLTYEDEHFDLARLRDFETAVAGRGARCYRIWARHRATGQVGGHTVLSVNPAQPRHGWQGDTAVSRDHRGHRLGLLLKLDMLRWLESEHPELEVIETWNNADNTYMIAVNEAIGYRLSRTFAMFELTLDVEPR